MQKYLIKSVWNAFFNIMNLFWDMKKISEKNTIPERKWNLVNSFLNSKNEISWMGQKSNENVLNFISNFSIKSRNIDSWTKYLNF